MRLATLDVWPDEPDLDLTINYRWLRGSMNAVARFAMGLFHDDDHLGANSRDRPPGPRRATTGLGMPPFFVRSA